MWTKDTGPINCIIPPHVLKEIAERGTSQHQREAAFRTLLSSARIRGRRDVRATLVGLSGTATGQCRRTIYDAQHKFEDSGLLLRGEGGKPTNDVDADAAYDNLGYTYEFLRAAFARNSIDGQGGRLDAVVHYGQDFNNAMWNGRVMIFGDGDRDLFAGFARSLDVTAHELAHGITEHTAGLEYHGQSGALNESFSDVVGSLVKQWHLGQLANQADWLIGADIFTPGKFGDALRSLKDPGTAYPSDPQPKHMSQYKHMTDDEDGDWGGVHINSGIPNHAFYQLAISLGDRAWDTAGVIWYESLKRLWPTANFEDCAGVTCAVAGQQFGASVQQLVAAAWDAVGVKLPATVMPRGIRGATRSAPNENGSLEALVQRIDRLERDLRALKG